MFRPFKSVSLGGVLFFFAMYPVLIAGTHQSENAAVETTPVTISPGPVVAVAASPVDIIQEEANNIYDSMHLKKTGLSQKAFVYAWKGYKQLLEKGQLNNESVLSICDFSQSSRRKRLYIIDIADMKLLVNTFVAHGRNSGGEYARSFSNKAESHKSSLGFYVTRKTYFGEHGLALKIEGLENGINDRADERNIVIHGSKYVGPNYLRNNRFSGRSFGCPAVPAKETQKVINTIKDGSCLFIYHPEKVYLSKSKILNG
jgi:hypothetical protein